MRARYFNISKIETRRDAISIDYIVKFRWYLDFEIELRENQFVFYS